MSVPKELKYSKDHVWIQSEGALVRLGITDFAQSELGDIVFVELPEVGDGLLVDEPFGSVESVKTISELSTPIAGKVVEVNEKLVDAPELVNESPHEKGWLVVLEPNSEFETNDLMSAAQYEEMIKED